MLDSTQSHGAEDEHDEGEEEGGGPGSAEGYDGDQSRCTLINNSGVLQVDGSPENAANENVLLEGINEEDNNPAHLITGAPQRGPGPSRPTIKKQRSGAGLKKRRRPKGFSNLNIGGHGGVGTTAPTNFGTGGVYASGHLPKRNLNLHGLSSQAGLKKQLEHLAKLAPTSQRLGSQGHGEGSGVDQFPNPKKKKQKSAGQASSQHRNHLGDDDDDENHLVPAEEEEAKILYDDPYHHHQNRIIKQKKGRSHNPSRKQSLIDPEQLMNMSGMSRASGKSGGSHFLPLPTMEGSRTHSWRLRESECLHLSGANNS